MYTAEEQAEHRQQWVAALRSGKYQQGEKRLRTNDKFCCLGVACDISGLGKWVHVAGSNMRGYFIDGIESQYELPDNVRDWLGVGSNFVGIMPRMISPDIVNLANANDGGYNFGEIADIVETGKIIVRE